MAHILVNQPRYPRILSALQRKISGLQKIAFNISVTHLKNAATTTPEKIKGLTSKQDSLSKIIEGLIELNSLLLNPDTKIKSTPLCKERLMQALRYNGGQPAKWIALATPVDKRGSIFECMPQSLQAIFQPHWGATALGT
jgi:hypothetical protein